MRLAYYVQSSHGLGHSFRAHKILKLIANRRPDWNIFALTDSGFLIALASKAPYDTIPVGRLIPKYSQCNTPPEAQNLIRSILVDALGIDVLLISHWKCLATDLNKIVPSIKDAGVKVVLALRDIIGQPSFESAVSHSFEMSFCDVLEKFIDGVAIFGNERLYQITQDSTAFESCKKLSYCGFVPPPVDNQTVRNRDLDVLCVVGGGWDGESVLETTMEALSLLRRDRKVQRVKFITGPYCKAETTAKLHLASRQANGITVKAFEQSWYGHTSSDTVIVCMGGYNTLTEAVFLGRKVICIPRHVKGVDEEQSMRAESLKNVANVTTIPMAELDAENVAANIRKALDSASLPPPNSMFDTGEKVQRFIEDIGIRGT